MHYRFKSYDNFITVFFLVFFIIKTSNIGMWGVYPEAIDLNIVLRTRISFWATISEVGSQKHFKKWGPFCRFLGSESALSSDTLTQNKI